MRKLQKFISIRRLFRDRVSGLTYEPNWFADQIVFLYLPFLLSSVLRGHSVYRWRWRWLTIEWIIFLWAIVLLPLTFSRAGLVIMVVILTAGLLFFRRSKATQKISRGRFIRQLALVGFIIIILVGLTFAAGTRNKFFARIWDYWERPNVSLGEYFYYLGFRARFTYWQTGYNIFINYPLLGVGLGNYAFYFEDMMPDFFLARQPEVLKVITPEPGRSLLITPKNYYVRLLAETGLLGTAMFFAFLIGLVGVGLYLWLSKEPNLRYWGAVSLLGLISFSLDAFSFDSFAIPNMWVVFGLITAAAQVYVTPLSKQNGYSLLTDDG
jgi:O-antigen ligase